MSVGAAVPTIYIPSPVCHLPVGANSNPFMTATLPAPPSQTVPSPTVSRLFQKVGILYHSYEFLNSIHFSRQTRICRLPKRHQSKPKILKEIRNHQQAIKIQQKSESNDRWTPSWYRATIIIGKTYYELSQIWSQMRRAEISSTTEKVHNSDISKILGKEWRAMADEDKQPYVEKVWNAPSLLQIS